LGLQTTAFVDLEMMRRRKLQPVPEMFAPTEQCPWRKRLLCGEVHDDNAYAMGGVAGHAGLFSTVDDVNQLVSCLLACYRGESTWLPSALVREFWTRDDRVPGSTWALGWDTPSPHGSSAGEFFSPHSIGHLGFTGASLWIDLDRQVQVIVLSNRVHPRRDNEKIKAFRPVLHDAIMRVVLGKSDQ
ncbi:MAG: serine hydrolase, partial [Candidatus Binatia bacterium]